MFLPDGTALARVQTAANPAESETAVRFFDPLVAHSYDVVVIDPPWKFITRSPKGQRKSASQHYRVMTLDEIKALPVRALLKKNAIVYLWATGAMLPQALKTMEAWGIDYKTEMSWQKMTPKRKRRMGLGFRARSCHEPIVVGTVGRPPKFTPVPPSSFDGIAREHSRKPDEFYSMIKACTPGLRRADVFARQEREGWDAWGDEVGKFSSGPSDEQAGVR
jgi:N6-adenosine-specific RNA methylase IME4